MKKIHALLLCLPLLAVLACSKKAEQPAMPEEQPADEQSQTNPGATTPETTEGQMGAVEGTTQPAQ